MLRFWALVVLGAVSLPAQWITLFDGTEKSMANWRTPGGSVFPVESWKIVDGCLVPIRTTTSRVDWWSVQTFRDFELEFEFKVESGSNGGIKYLVQTGNLNRIRKGKYIGKALDVPAEPGDLVTETTLGLEYQILDDNSLEEGRKPLTRTAALYQMMPALNVPIAEPGVFHKGRIVVRGNSVEHYLNDTLAMRATLGSPEMLASAEATKRNPVLRTMEKRETPVVITHHWTPVHYRSIRIRRLGSDVAGLYRLE